MNEFLQTALGFPTIVFSTLLTVCMCVWLIAAFGLVDTTDGWDVDVSDVVDADGGLHGLAGILARLGLGGVPFMVMLTILSLAMWVTSFFLHQWVLSWFPDIVRWVLGLGVIAGSLVVGLAVTNLILRPIRWLAVRYGPKPHPPILGRVGVVISAQVDAEDGRIEVDDGGAGLIFHAKTSSGDVYPRGSKVVIVDVDQTHTIYEVVSQSQFDRK